MVSGHQQPWSGLRALVSSQAFFLTSLFHDRKKIFTIVKTIMLPSKSIVSIREKMRQSPPLKTGYEIRVEFDFPEKCRNRRDSFRYLLKTTGFQMFQRSIWVFQFNALALLQWFLKKNNLTKWVDVIIVKK